MYKTVLLALFGALALGMIHTSTAQDGASGLRLTGVMVSGPASMAIIAGADGREKAYRLGHEILPGATLAEVSAHGIMIARDRGRQWLPLVGGSGAPERLVVPAAQVPPRVAEPKAGIAVGTSSVAEPAERRSKFSPELAKQNEDTQR